MNKARPMECDVLLPFCRLRILPNEVYSLSPRGCHSTGVADDVGLHSLANFGSSGSHCPE